MSNKEYLDIISNGMYNYLNWYQKIYMYIVCIFEKREFVKKWSYIKKSYKENK